MNADKLKDIFEQIGGQEWEKEEHHRMYFNDASQILGPYWADASKTRKRKFQNWLRSVYFNFNTMTFEQDRWNKLNNCDYNDVMEYLSDRTEEIANIRFD